MNYTTIDHDVRMKFDLSCNDYCIADIISRDAASNETNPGWATISKDRISQLLGLSRNSTISAVKKLIKKGLVLRDKETDWLSPSEVWISEFTLPPGIIDLGYLIPDIGSDRKFYGQVRLLRPTTKRKASSGWSRIRLRVFKRDGYTCAYCGAFDENPDCDHVFPISRGGLNTMDNLATACKRCNRQKKDRDLDEFLNWKQYNP